MKTSKSRRGRIKNRFFIFTFWREQSARLASACHTHQISISGGCILQKGRVLLLPLFFQLSSSVGLAKREARIISLAGNVSIYNEYTHQTNKAWHNLI
jgi:hypothetical protein